MTIAKIVTFSLYSILVALVAWIGFMLGEQRETFFGQSEVLLEEQIVSAPEQESFEVSILPTLAASRLSVENYVLRKEKLRSLVKEMDPNSAFDELGRWIRDGEVRYECNNFTYDIGYAAYERYGTIDLSLPYQRYFCGYGYFHGVLGAYFAQAGDTVEVMRERCDAFPREQDRGECYHQAGHSLRHASGDDLMDAIGQCDLFSDKGIRRWCSLGVFHQNFSPHEGPGHTNHEGHRDLWKVCGAQDPIHQANCYKLAPRAYLQMEEKGAAKVLDWCKGAPAPYDLLCMRGATWDIMQYTYDLEEVERFCVSDGTERTMAACIDQMVAMLLATRTREEMREFCKTLLIYPATQERCLQAADIEKKWEY